MSVSKSPEPTAVSPEDKADTNDKAEPTTETKAEESDESKANSTEVEKAEPNKEPAPKSKFPTMSKRDYAFIREKDKRRQQKQKYEARIKELEDEEIVLEDIYNYYERSHFFCRKTYRS